MSAPVYGRLGPTRPQTFRSDTGPIATWAKAINTVRASDPALASAMLAGKVREVLLDGEVVRHPHNPSPKDVWNSMSNLARHELFERDAKAFRALRDAARRS